MDWAAMSKTARTTVVGVLITAALAGIFTVAKSGIKSIVQQEARDAVTDTISRNVSKIEKLEKTLNENEKRDNEIHPRVAELERTLQRVEKELTMLRSYVDEQNKKIDKLTDILLKYFNEK